MVQSTWLPAKSAEQAASLQQADRLRGYGPLGRCAAGWLHCVTAWQHSESVRQLPQLCCRSCACPEVQCHLQSIAVDALQGSQRPSPCCRRQLLGPPATKDPQVERPSRSPAMETLLRASRHGEPLAMQHGERYTPPCCRLHAWGVATAQRFSATATAVPVRPSSGRHCGRPAMARAGTSSFPTAARYFYRQVGACLCPNWNKSIAASHWEQCHVDR